jgi:hypothetical protein
MTSENYAQDSLTGVKVGGGNDTMIWLYKRSDPCSLLLKFLISTSPEKPISPPKRSNHKIDHQISNLVSNQFLTHCPSKKTNGLLLLPLNKTSNAEACMLLLPCGNLTFNVSNYYGTRLISLTIIYEPLNFFEDEKKS